MKRHTAPPWFVQLRNQQSPLICYAGDMAPPPAVAEVFPAVDDDLGEETLANANVLAAAPDLLEALEAVCDHYIDVNTPFEDDEERRVVALADRAMAKAGGRAEGRETWQQGSDLAKAANGVLAWIDRAIPREQIDNEAVAALRAALDDDS